MISCRKGYQLVKENDLIVIVEYDFYILIKFLYVMLFLFTC